MKRAIWAACLGAVLLGMSIAALAGHQTRDVQTFLWIDAASRNAVGELEALVAHGFDPRGARDYDFRTAQHLAAAEGALEAAVFLVDELDLNPMPVDRFGGSPVNDAVRHDQPALAEFFLSRNAVLLGDHPRIEGKIDSQGRLLTAHVAEDDD